MFKPLSQPRHAHKQQNVIDEKWMAQAIALAYTGKYTTSPNPNVGCVIVDEGGKKVGEGAHLKAGEPHAEVHALRQAGDKAKGATAYVTLEPCSHTGRTPPCADALIKAQVKRVVIANTDPNPNVNGEGIARMRNAGIEVLFDVLGKKAEELNVGFFKRMKTGRPWVTLKMAASLDGKTALENGKSQWITGPEARKDVQQFRAQSCAVLTGSGTVRDDNPSLLVRPQQAQLTDYPHHPVRQPLRIVIEGKTPLSSNLQLFNDGEATLLITCKEFGNSTTNNANTVNTINADTRQFAQSVHRHSVNAVKGYPSLIEVLDYLGEYQCNNLWVEAGSTLAGAFIEQGLVDDIIVYLAPKLLGHTGRPMLVLPNYQVLTDVPNLLLKDCVQIGDDIRLMYRFI